jgi:hypothetical protein
VLRGGAERHLETSATAIAWYTSDIAAVVAGELANQGEAKANPALATLTHAGGTVEGGKDTFPLRFWHPWPAVGNTELYSSRDKG